MVGCGRAIHHVPSSGLTPQPWSSHQRGILPGPCVCGVCEGDVRRGLYLNQKLPLCLSLFASRSWLMLAKASLFLALFDARPF